VSWPEPPEWLQLEVEPRRLRRGETVAVTMRADRERLGERRRELGLACLCHHAGGFKTREVGDAGGRFRVDRQDVVCDDWRLVEHDEGRFEFTVPQDGPYSYEGDVVSFYWGIWLRPEAKVLDREAYVPLVVDP
jgi:hypothetical protein